MSASKHTPGPWMVGGTRGKLEGQSVHTVFRYDAEKKRDEDICAVWFDTKTGLGLPDARLIAAAPDLLDALENLTIAIAMGWDLDGCVDVARAAIDKATA